VVTTAWFVENKLHYYVNNIQIITLFLSTPISSHQG
jgi:hypothetical protein